MDGLEFHDEKQNTSFGNKLPYEQKSSGIEGFLIEKGIAKNKGQAQLIMTIITLLCFGLTAWIIFG